LAPIYPVYPTAGLQFVLIAYVAVVLGGLGDMVGALIAALAVSAVEVVGSYTIGTAWKEVLYLLLFIGILVVRPAGLFGQRGAEALVVTRWELSPWLGLAVGALVAMAIGLVVGYLSNRLRGPYFVLATIAFSQVLLIVGSRWRGFTSGSEGIPVPFRPGFWTLG